MTELEDLYTAMLRIRVFEDEVHRLFLRQEIPGTAHLYQGQEAVAVGVCSMLEEGDSVSATYRGHGAALALGTDATALMAEMLGRETGTCGGRGGSMNVIDVENGLLGCFGIVGGSIAAATGAALASSLTEDDTVAIAFFGDGATNQAYFHECLNFASVMSLPVVYVCENNLYGEWTAMSAVTGGGAIAPRAAAYGIPGHVVDGNDVLAVREAAGAAVDAARDGEGPTLLECQTYRHKGHSKLEPARYRPREELEAWLARDPLTLFAPKLPAGAAERIAAEVQAEMAQVLEVALAAPQARPLAGVSATREPQSTLTTTEES
jgi:TPP-dependent pyruvate/acetoin dehydrogenase alpha subunit